MSITLYAVVVAFALATSALTEEDKKRPSSRLMLRLTPEQCLSPSSKYSVLEQNLTITDIISYRRWRRAAYPKQPAIQRSNINDDDSISIPPRERTTTAEYHLAISNEASRRPSN